MNTSRVATIFDECVFIQVMSLSEREWLMMFGRTETCPKEALKHLFVKESIALIRRNRKNGQAEAKSYRSSKVSILVLSSMSGGWLV